MRRRRAALKKARLATPAPEPAVEFAGYTLDELRILRAELNDYETRVSYWRRLVQARIDLAQEGKRPRSRPIGSGAGGRAESRSPDRQPRTVAG